MEKALVDVVHEKAQIDLNYLVRAIQKHRRSKPSTGESLELPFIYIAGAMYIVRILSRKLVEAPSA